MQPVVVPGTAVLDGLEGPQVEHRAAVAVGDRAHMPVVRRDLAAQVLEDRDVPGVEAGGHHDRADGGGQSGHGLLEALRDVVGVGSGTDDVVAAGGEGHQVRGQFDGARELVLHDLVEELAAYGEVRVPEGVLGGPVVQEDGETVGPAHEGPVGTGVPDAFGEAVPHRRVGPNRAAAE